MQLLPIRRGTYEKTRPRGARLMRFFGCGRLKRRYLQVFATACASSGTVWLFSPAMFMRESPTM